MKSYKLKKAPKMSIGVLTFSSGPVGRGSRRFIALEPEGLPLFEGRAQWA